MFLLCTRSSQSQDFWVAIHVRSTKNLSQSGQEYEPLAVFRALTIPIAVKIFVTYIQLRQVYGICLVWLPPSPLEMCSPTILLPSIIREELGML